MKYRICPLCHGTDKEGCWVCGSQGTQPVLKKPSLEQLRFDHTNANGLVDGDIPAGRPCPFLSECGLRMDRCPSPTNLKLHGFSCGCARAFSITKRPKNES